MTALARAFLSEEASREALALTLVALGLLASGIGFWQANVAARWRSECERLRAECQRLRAENNHLRPLAEITEVQTATARLLAHAAAAGADKGDGEAHGLTVDLLRRTPTHPTPAPKG